MSNGSLMPPAATHPVTTSDVAPEIVAEYADPSARAAFVVHMDGTAGGATSGAAPTPLPDYSLTEQPNGRRWIDGKIIYQKTIPIGPLPVDGEADTPHGILNIDTMVDLQGTATDPSSPQYFIKLPQVNTADPTYNVGVWADGTNVTVVVQQDMSGYQEAHVTMLYTCTDR